MNLLYVTKVFASADGAISYVFEQLTTNGKVSADGCTSIAFDNDDSSDQTAYISGVMPIKAGIQRSFENNPGTRILQTFDIIWK